MDSNEDESYDFQLTGEEVEPVKVKIVKSKILKKGFAVETLDGFIKSDGFKTKLGAKYWVYDERELELED